MPPEDAGKPGGIPDSDGKGSGNDTLPTDIGEALAMIRDQKTLITKLRGMEHEHEKLKKANERRDREQLSETERLKAEKVDLEKQIAEVQRRANEKLARASVIEQAVKANFRNPSVAWSLLKEALTIDEEGTVSGLESALAKLAKDEPYLLKEGAPAPGGKPDEPSPARPPSAGNPGQKAKLSADALRKMTPHEVALRLMSDKEFAKQIEEAQRPG